MYIKWKITNRHRKPIYLFETYQHNQCLYFSLITLSLQWFLSFSIGFNRFLQQKYKFENVQQFFYSYQKNYLKGTNAYTRLSTASKQLCVFLICNFKISVSLVVTWFPMFDCQSQKTGTRLYDKGKEIMCIFT